MPSVEGQAVRALEGPCAETATVTNPVLAVALTNCDILHGLDATCPCMQVCHQSYASRNARQ